MKIIYLGIPVDAAMLTAMLGEVYPGTEMVVAGAADSMVAAAGSGEACVVIADHDYEGCSAEAAMKALERSGLKTDVLLLTRQTLEQEALALVKKGVTDYVFKENPGRLVVAINNSFRNQRLQREKELAISHTAKADRYYQTLIRNINDFIFLFNDKGELIYQSPSANELTGFDTLEDRNVFEFIHPDDLKKFLSLFKRVQARAGSRRMGQFRILHKNGHYIWIEGSIANSLNDESVQAFILSCREITERKEAEKKLIHANRLYALISQINQAIVSIDNECELYREACGIAVAYGSFDVAFVVALDQEQLKLRLIEGKGIPTGYELGVEIPFVAGGPQDHVLQTGSYFVCNDMERDFPEGYWKIFAAQHGYQSIIVLPIRKSGQIVASFNLWSKETGFFDSGVIALLEETAGDISFALDVFEKEKLRQQADARLKYSEGRLRQAQAIAHLGSWELDFTTGIADWSDETLNIYGLAPGENKQSFDSWMSFIHPDDKAYVLGLISVSEARQENADFFHRILRRDGTVRHLHSQSHFIFDADGKPVGLYGVAHDITTMKEAEEALKASEARYSDLFNLSPQPKWVYDTETFQIVQVNRAAIEQYGYTEEEFLNMTIMDIRPPEDVELVKESINDKKVQMEGNYNRKFRHYKKSGELIDVEIYSSSMIINDKTYRSVLAIDVTEKNLHDDKVTNAIIQTQENERYEIGAELHDNVCQILASTLVRLAMLQSTLPPEARQAYYQCRENIQLATRELRNLSHRLAPAFFDDSTLDDSVRILLNSFNISDKYQIKYHFDPELSQYELSRDVKLNLYRILQEQLGNILKHAAATEIRVAIALEDDSITMAIADNGIGCDVSELKSGIGTANMKRRVQLFSGDIEISSLPNKGYQVRLQIPIQEAIAEKVSMTF